MPEKTAELMQQTKRQHQDIMKPSRVLHTLEIATLLVRLGSSNGGDGGRSAQGTKPSHHQRRASSVCLIVFSSESTFVFIYMLQFKLVRSRVETELSEQCIFSAGRAAAFSHACAQHHATTVSHSRHR